MRRTSCDRLAIASSPRRRGYQFVASLVSRVAAAIDGTALVRVLAALFPLGVLALVSGKPEWLEVSLVTVSTAIAVDRSRLAPLAVIAHGIAIGAGFMVLMASLASPPLFVGATALLAMGSILVIARGSELRSLGSFTFIPVLYLACESAEGVRQAALIHRGFETLPFIWTAFLPVLLIASIDHYRQHRPEVSWVSHFTKWSTRADIGDRVPYVEAMIAVTLAVGVAAALVEWRHIEHGQWMIWSAASVVTGSAASARLKFRHRITGATVGVPAGILAGLLVPHDAFSRDLIVLAALLTLVCIRPYVLAFGTRCGCAAMAFVVAGQPWTFASERLINVVLGSAIGLLFTLAVHVIARRVKLEGVAS
ncbi:FUSC family protein [Paraburkholderia terrae]|uniref:FUSC family protein n=1 Tax=Paraburkholderia terrae TaxID=311230 RepID=A0A2I8F4L7_9BURK|nr:FUSC family protein [Paraburkholderia terrae]AUT66669.1 FUSC family protein [Paraburkholderia terrae]